MNTDIELGFKINAELMRLGIETPTVGIMDVAAPDANKKIIQNNFAGIMHELKLDLEDDSLKDTPKRIAKMYVDEIFSGLDYSNFPKCTTIENKMKFDELVLVRDIKVHSLCEHHFVPFIGHAHVAYIPDRKVVGLSKLNRVVDFFCRRPQVQERLTEQVAAAFQYILGTADVAVVIEAEHLCVKLRGVKDSSSNTITSKLGGRFKENSTLRAEFFSLITKGK